MKVASKKQGRMIVGGVVLGGILLGMTAMACYINRVGTCPPTWPRSNGVWKLVDDQTHSPQTYIYVEECARSSSESGYLHLEWRDYDECLYESPDGSQQAYRYHYMKRADIHSARCSLPPCPGSSSS